MLQAHKDQRARRVRLGRREPQAHKDLLAHRGQQEPQAQRVRLEQQELRAHKDLRARRELRDLKDPLELD